MTVTPNQKQPDNVVEFHLHPHRSLSLRGFLIVISFIGGSSFLIGISFWFVGAWPVIGFMGLEVGVVVIAFLLNYRAAGRRELVRVGPQEVELVCVDPRLGQSQQTFQTYWLQVRLLPAEPKGLQLLIGTHGKFAEIGGFLSDHEKTNLAQALRAQLADMRVVQA